MNDVSPAMTLLLTAAFVGVPGWHRFSTLVSVGGMVFWLVAMLWLIRNEVRLPIPAAAAHGATVLAALLVAVTLAIRLLHTVRRRNLRNGSPPPA